MADQLPEGPAVTIGFSIQNDGQMIGVHIELPMCAYAFGLPIPSAEELVKNFPTELAATIAQAKKQNSGIVVANGETLNVLKGK